MEFGWLDGWIKGGELVVFVGYTEGCTDEEERGERIAAMPTGFSLVQ